MDEIITERSGGLLRVELNRPSKKNPMTSSMYVTFADVFNDAAKDERVRVVLWHAAGDSFCADNDIEDFLKKPPRPGNFPQARLMKALVDFDKPLIAVVQGAAIRGGTTLTHVTSYTLAKARSSRCPSSILPWCRNLDRASPYARKAAELGLVTQVVSDQNLLATATETARKLLAKPAGALQASKKLMKQSFREQIKAAMQVINEEFSAQVRSEDAKEALAAFLQKRPPNFNRTTKAATAA
jgi:enoyl-CoA hydratase/carnithine racemase